MMKIDELLKDKITFSFEVFPPKLDQPLEPLRETLEHLYAYKPDFISCTYGAGGTNKGRSIEVCNMIQSSGNNAMTHFTCIGNSKEEIVRDVKEYMDLGVENVLALRGDIPEGMLNTGGELSHGNELVALLEEHFSELCIGAACYPEKHLESISLDDDIRAMKMKQDAGADFFTTQLCHDVEKYKHFRELADKEGITKPVIVGLMPVLNKDAIIHMTVSNGCTMPRELQDIIDKYGDSPEDFKKAGKEYTVKQIHRYMDAGINGLHIYSLNRYKDIADIIDASGICK